MFLNASPWEIGAMIHPHPSLSEVIGEAALAIEGKAIHFINSERGCLYD